MKLVVNNSTSKRIVERPILDQRLAVAESQFAIGAFSEIGRLVQNL